jgi:hypothetical protein
MNKLMIGLVVGLMAGACGSSNGSKIDSGTTIDSPTGGPDGPAGGPDAPAGAPNCSDYCAGIATTCTAGFQQYPDTASCMTACAALPAGAAGDSTGDTIGCRMTHTTLAMSGPMAHCPHAGPGGGDVCGTECESFCTLDLAICTGAQAAYTSMADCMTSCAGYDATADYNTTQQSGNTFACRLYHLMKAASSSAAAMSHCGHTSMSGGGVCI